MSHQGCVLAFTLLGERSVPRLNICLSDNGDEGGKTWGCGERESWDDISIL